MRRTMMAPVCVSAIRMYSSDVVLYPSVPFPGQGGDLASNTVHDPEIGGLNPPPAMAINREKPVTCDWLFSCAVVPDLGALA